MKTPIITALLLGLSAPVLTLAAECTPEHAAMGHCTLETPVKPAPKPQPAAKPITSMPAAGTCTPEHAAMGHCKMEASTKPAKPAPKPQPAMKPMADMPAAGTCTPEHEAMGHCKMPAPAQPAKPAAAPQPAMKPMASMPVAGTCTPEHEAMGHCKSDSTPAIPVSDGSAATDIPMPFPGAMHMADDPFLSRVIIDRLEIINSDEGDKPVLLDAEAWFGKDLHKLWLKTEVKQVGSDTDEAQLQVLYSRAIAPYWDIQAGVRKDFKPVDREWATLGIKGVAPYFIDLDAALFVGEAGRTALSFSGERELMLSQKTALIPELGLNFFGQDDPEAGTGSGLSEAKLSLRLQHELRREFAPYIGVSWSKLFGGTADYAREAGETTEDTQVMLGIHAWF
ncbi:MAG: copper resistance protein B [Thiothrix sp.]|nr:copper resistance protein B [Thiothrix sp.]HPQ97304.1 copper resistance protein B [Thiolinea sp.]